MASIVPFETLTPDQTEEAAGVLVRAFAAGSPAWPDLRAGREEVATFFADPERRAWAAVEEGRVLGWIGRVEAYPSGWEIHPVAVDPAHQRRGIGRQLMGAIEEMAAAAGMSTLFVGADDDFGGTTIFGVDLYEDLCRHIKDLAPAGTHPVAFYRRLDFAVVGLLPDVNGPGKPDILMAKRVRQREPSPILSGLPVVAKAAPGPD